MKENHKKSFSSGPPRYLVCCDGRPIGVAARFEAALEIAGDTAAQASGGSVTIYEIATGVHVDVAKAPDGGAPD